MAPLLQVVVASTRPTRIGRPIGDWFAEAARQDGRFDVELVDLLEVDLPMMMEPNHPRLQQYTLESTKKWSQTVARGDAYALVMPEYNYGYTAPLKNALDTVSVEWNNKPVTLVTYGGISGGLRAGTVIKPVLSALKLFCTTQHVIIPMAMKGVSDGVFTPTEEVAVSVTPTLDELYHLQQATNVLRG